MVDWLAVALLAPLWLPLFGLCALAIWIEGRRGPVLFRQERTGRDGRRFVMYKFRTMVPDADRLKGALQLLNERRWPDFKIENDPRVTRVGRLLRRLSLDELPQLLNVLRGDMTLVGPRPTSFSADTYQDWQRARLAVTPGLTGLWQIAGRGQLEFEERVLMDLEYVRRRSIRLDFAILVRTIPVILFGKGGC